MNEAYKSDFSNVRQDWVLYDTVRIGPDVPTNVTGWYPSFTALADAAVPISFFDQRQEGEAGTTYTNMKKKTGLDFSAIFTDIGIGLFYPDPVNVDMFDGDRAAGKLFGTTLPQHAHTGLFVGGSDLKILELRPEMQPYGFGPTGNQSGPTAGFSSLVNMGEALAGNRFRFANLPLKLPKDISISTKLTFSQQGKTLLRAMDTVKPISFATGDYPNEALIVCAIRGMREVQQLGNLHR